MSKKRRLEETNILNKVNKNSKIGPTNDIHLCVFLKRYCQSVISGRETGH